MIWHRYLGRVPYDDALRLQAELVELRYQGRIDNVLLLLEHPPVLTLGRNAKRANVLASDELLARRGVTLHEINRGGDVTYHGPGQLVGYPIFDLRSLRNASGGRLGPVDFVRLMEEALIRVCGAYGVRAGRIAGLTGVWCLAGGELLNESGELECGLPSGAKQAAEKLTSWRVRASVEGTGFSPYIQSSRMNGALAPEGHVSHISPEIEGFSGASEAPSISEGSKYGLKPVPSLKPVHSLKPAPSREAGLDGDSGWSGGAASSPARERKIGAIGIHVSRGITSHGFAFNVTTNLRDFALINPCGITDKPVTSLEREVADAAGVPRLEEVAEEAARQFGFVFGEELAVLESLDALRAGAADGLATRRVEFPAGDTPLTIPAELERLRGMVDTSARA